MTEAPQSRWRWIWSALGVGMMAWGVWGLVTHTSTTALVHAARLFVIDVVGHDGLFAPVAFLVAWSTQRLLPPVVRTPVRTGLAVGGLLVLLAMPLILSDHRLRSSSVLPLPYGRNLAVLLVGVAAGVAVGVAVNSVRATLLSRSRAPRQPG
jgi:hypothetical protein